MRPTFSHAAVSVATLCILGSGCAGKDAVQAPTDSQSSGRSDDQGGEAAVLRDARTAADRKNRICSAPTDEPVTETLYDAVLTAEGDVTIDDVRVVGDRVRLVDVEGAVVVGDPRDVGRGISASWPWQDVRGPSIDPTTRTDLIGMTVRDGQHVLPLLRLRFRPDSEVRGLTIEYTRGEVRHAELFVPMHSTYARFRSGC